MVTVWDANVAQRNVNGVTNDKQADHKIYFRLQHFGLTVYVNQMLCGMNGNNSQAHCND